MLNLPIVPPMRQRSWGWLAVLNLSLGGAGTAFYLIGTIFAILGRSFSEQNQFFSFQILAPVIVGCGFLAIAIEAGRPMRAYRLFSIFSGSWMSIESLAGVIFIFSAFAYWISSSFVLHIIAVIAAFIFLVSQGFIVYRAVAVTAWKVWLIPVIFLSSGFMTACGLVLLNIRFNSGIDSFPIVISIVCIVFNLIVWLLYLYHNTDDKFKDAVRFLRQPIILLIIGGASHIIPFFFLFYIVVFVNGENGYNLSVILRIISGLLIFLGGVNIKAGITFAAGYCRAIEFKTAA